jgi:hypothetical protein
MQARKNLRVALGFFFISIAGFIHADAQTRPNNDLPPVILSGLDAYKAEGPEAAIRAWIKGSPIEGSKDALAQSNVLRQIQDFYGSYKSYDVISARILSPNIRILYLGLNYEKGPLFSKFIIFQTAQGWILTSFNFNTKEELILPPPQ